MALDTYAGLKAEILGMLNRDDLSDAEIDTFIDLAEERHRYDIRIRPMLTRSQASVIKRYVALPERFIGMKSLVLLTSPKATKLRFVNLYRLNDLRTDMKGRPTYFAIHEEIEFDCEPDTTYTAEIVHYAHFEPLSGNNPSNGLLVRSPGTYLYGALVASAQFLDHDERIPTWENSYNNIVERMSTAERQGHNPGPLVSRVEGTMP